MLETLIFQRYKHIIIKLYPKLYFREVFKNMKQFNDKALFTAINGYYSKKEQQLTFYILNELLIYTEHSFY